MAPPQPPTDRKSFRVAIICALPREANAVFLLFDHFWDEQRDRYGRADGDTNTYITGRIGNHDVVLAILPNMGANSAAAATAGLRSSFMSLRLALIVGICGGVPCVAKYEEFLGDVVVSKSIVQYDCGTQYPGRFVVKSTVDDSLGRSNNGIRGLLAVFEKDLTKERLRVEASKYLQDLQNAAKKKEIKTNYQYPGASKDILYAPDYVHKHRDSCRLCASDSGVFCEAASKASCAEAGCSLAGLVSRERPLKVDQSERFTPEIFIGRIGSGNTVMKSGEDRDRIAASHDLIAFEMEGAGAWDEVPCMVVKGICDYADSHKNKAWQDFAAATAASVAKAILGRYAVYDGDRTISERQRHRLPGFSRSDPAIPVESFQLLNSLPPNPIRSSGNRTISSNTFGDNTRIHQGDQIVHNHESRYSAADCLADLFVTDPQDDKSRIEALKGGLLKDSYSWILDHKSFLEWRDDPGGCLLWIRADPRKGKTMLLCGIIDELIKENDDSRVAFFFCQETDSRINSATSVLRGLIYMLVKQQESLMKHLMQRYKGATKHLFEDANAWVALSDILTNMLQDPACEDKILIIDALDECITDLPKLLGLIRELSNSAVRLIVSSRNWLEVDVLRAISRNVLVQLELNAGAVSNAVDIFINHRVERLPQLSKDDGHLKEAVRQLLSDGADGTFLWVAIVCEAIHNPRLSKYEIIQKIKEFPQGLVPLYQRMLNYILSSPSAQLHRQVLATMAIVYRPVTLQEMASLIPDLRPFGGDLDEIGRVVKACGSFLCLRQDVVYFVHQSAKDFLLSPSSGFLSASSASQQHHVVCMASLDMLSKTLKRDIYSVGMPGFHIDDVKPPIPNPMDPIHYCRDYWVHHLQHSGLVINDPIMKAGGALDEFLRAKLLNWLEAINWVGKLGEGLIAMALLNDIVRNVEALQYVIMSASQVAHYFRPALETTPIQLYISGLLFSPPGTEELFFRSENKDSYLLSYHKVDISNEWSENLNTLTDPPAPTQLASVKLSADRTRILTQSTDGRVQVWDTTTGRCLRTGPILKDAMHCQVAFSRDLRFMAIARGASLKICNLWDDAAPVGDKMKTKTLSLLTKVYNHVSEKVSIRKVVFSDDGEKIASVSEDCRVCIRDVGSGAMVQTWRGNLDTAFAGLKFSRDGREVFVWAVNQLQIWDIASGKLQLGRTYECRTIHDIDSSTDLQCLAICSDKGTFISDRKTGSLIGTMNLPQGVTEIAFDSDSNDSLRTVSGTFSLKDGGRGFHLSLDGKWIMRNTERMVWLPADYQVQSKEISGNTIVIAGTQGGFITAQFRS